MRSIMCELQLANDATIYLIQWYPTLTSIPLNSGFRVPRLALETCSQRNPKSINRFPLRATCKPPPPLAAKLKSEVSPEGRFAVVRTAPPANSMYGTAPLTRMLEFHRNTTGSNPPP